MPENENKLTYRLEGMSCQGCARSLKKALETRHIRVELSDIDVQRGEVLVSASTPNEQVVSAIVAAGFEPQTAETKRA